MKKEGELTAYVMFLTVGEKGHSWFVSHRYSEYEALKNFLAVQESNNVEIQKVLKQFPGKVVGINFRKQYLSRRIEGLQTFVSYVLENSRYLHQPSVYALLSFLEIPENLRNIIEIRSGNVSPDKSDSTLRFMDGMNAPVVINILPKSASSDNLNLTSGTLFSNAEISRSYVDIIYI